jgi:hypothetical protein
MAEQVLNKAFSVMGTHGTSHFFNIVGLGDQTAAIAPIFL